MAQYKIEAIKDLARDFFADKEKERVRKLIQRGMKWVVHDPRASTARIFKTRQDAQEWIRNQ